MSGAPAPLSAARALDLGLRTRRDGDAVVGRSGRLTYRELDQLADCSARALRSAGIAPGDRVAVSLPNDLPIVGLFLGAMRLGAIWVGVNRQLAPPEKAYILGDCGASLLVGDAETVAAVAGERDRPAGAGDGRLGTLRLLSADPAPETEWASLLRSEPTLPPAPDPLEPAAIAYTSGTTGFPKGAVHTQHNLMLPGAGLVAARGYDDTLRKADCFPLTILNLQVLVTLLVAQAAGTAIVMDRVDPGGIAEWLAAERPTTWNGAPAMLYSLAEDDAVPPAALASLREVWTGGSACPASVRTRFTAKFGLPVTTTYGLTEAPAMVTILPPGDVGHADTSGTPLPHLRVAILGDDGGDLPAGDVGRIVVGPAVDGPWAGAYRPMTGYWGRPEATGAVLQGGTLDTGDLGSLSADGFLSVSDRRSSLILRGGANVYPAEVERVVDRFPGVRSSCVVGTPDERLGQRVLAVVELSAGSVLDADALRAHCADNLARYKVPEHVIVADLPRNSMGKIQRSEVARRFAGAVRPPGPGVDTPVDANASVSPGESHSPPT